MKYAQPLIRAVLIRRYKRFLADVTLGDGREVIAHCANPGAMTGLATPGTALWLEPNNDPKRKLRYSWKLAEIGGALVGIDTALPNKVVGEALRAGMVSALSAYKTVRAEVRYGENSRVDFLLTQAGLPDCYVEVKSANLCRRAGLVEFPDTVTKRGAKHMEALAAMVAEGHRAVVLYLVQRSDCEAFAVADDIDPAYSVAFTKAHKAGVEALCYQTDLSLEGASFGEALPIVVR
ncbi:MAG: DNA/RNA nuclease SfsA [Rhodobacteraceae bacterium]|nr:DNA/RNA nuclease SfsA [Paracoccaceae bacterium]